MKKFMLVAVIAFITFAFSGTKTWVYLNPDSVQNIGDYDEALAKSDLDRYRYFDKRNTLHFESGLNVELLSANELSSQGIPVKTDRVRTSEPEFDTKPVFRLSAGVIIEVQTRVKVK